MKLILDISGGGALGIIPAEVCYQLESYLNTPLYKIFDLISGTSTGAILGSQLASGVPAAICRDLYLKQAPQLFKARSKWLPWNWAKEKYDRQPFLDAIANSFELKLSQNESNVDQVHVFIHICC